MPLSSFHLDINILHPMQGHQSGFLEELVYQVLIFPESYTGAPNLLLSSKRANSQEVWLLLLSHCELHIWGFK